MCYVPAGSFQMGCNSLVDSECENDENPRHSVTVSAFWIDRYEVTVVDYERCVDGGGCTPADTGGSGLFGRCVYGYYDEYPINCVDWKQAKAYCEWAEKRLPSEAEWEKAARGTDGRKYPWGNDALDCEHAVLGFDNENCKDTMTAPVGSRPAGASPYGAEDMIGNVAEWIDDDYHDNYNAAPNDGVAWLDDPRSSNRVLRGGNADLGIDPVHLRTSDREAIGPDYSGVSVGFRCAAAAQ